MAFINIVEVGPRDGLQNEKASVPTEAKLALITDLLDAGLQNIELTSFVRPSAIPQLADAPEVIQRLAALRSLDELKAKRLSALVPNLKGLERILEVNQSDVLSEIAVLTAVSETFNQRNINMTVEQSLTQMEPVITRALSAGLTVRGYLSTAFYCPYEGKMNATSVLSITQRLFALGVREVSIGDTIGKANPDDVRSVLSLLLENIPANQIALHFHDTNGLALQNVETALNMDITTFDSSAGGLGGCPYAPGASGNLSTDSLVAYLESNGYETGVDSKKLAMASQRLMDFLDS